MQRGDRREGRGDGVDAAGEPAVSREIAAEAAAWIARLHGPDRSRHMERECLAWQARSPAHRLAFERCTDLWMDVVGVDRGAVARAAVAHGPEGLQSGEDEGALRVGQGAWPRPRPCTLALSAVATAALATVLLVFQPWRDIDTYDTGIGEQRLVLLQDGTRMSLNTSTRVKVELGQTQRRVSVEGGEAFFEVAKDQRRPFVVQAAGTEVTATGTAFVVRLAPAGAGTREALDVTLVEGQVLVRGAESQANRQTAAEPIVMAAGERLRIGGDRGDKGTSGAGAAAVAPPHRDRPRIDQLLAWKRGEAIFDNASLQDALAEMSRYSLTPVVADASLADLRLSGVFKTGDNASFARAVAELHGLAVRERPDRLELQPR